MLHYQRRRAHPGTCRSCMKRRDVFSIGRSGGSTYRRGGRHYSSNICGECATSLLAYASPHAGGSTSRFSNSGLERIVASLGTEEAAEVFTAYRERGDHTKWLREAA